MATPPNLRYGISLFVANCWPCPSMQDYLDTRGFRASRNDHRRFHNLGGVLPSPILSAGPIHGNGLREAILAAPCLLFQYSEKTIRVV